METRLPHAVARNARPDRGDTTRQKLLRASIDVFGRHGFDGATTRTLADPAGVHLQALPYPTGRTAGLYVPAADPILALIPRPSQPFRTRFRPRPTGSERPRP